MADLNTPAGQLGNAIGGVGGGMQGVSKDIQARMELQDNLRRYFGQADIFGGEAFFDDLEKGADFRLMKTDHGGSHVVKIGRGDTGHQVSVDNQRFNKWNAQNKATAAAGTVAPSATRSSVPVAAAPSMEDLKAAGVKVPETIPPTSTADLSPERMSFIETLKAEKAATEETARKAIPATRQSIEESGYLYHYAPREARESIVSGGFDVSKARTAVSDIAGAGSEFATHVPDNSMYFYTNPNDAPSAGTIFGTGETGQRPDLYRVKVEPGMLDDMAVDPRLPVRDGVGSAVIVPSKTGKFQAELIGENAQFGIRGENISPATHDPIRSTSAVSTADDLIEPSVVRKVEDPTREAYDAARAKGELIVTEPVTPKPPPSAPAAGGGTSSPKPKGPSNLGAPADIKIKPGAHGAPTVPPPGPPPPPPPGPPTTSPTAPTAKIVTNNPSNNLTAREALRGIGDDIKSARKPGQRLLSADGSKAMAEAVTRGIKGSRNLKMLAVGSALGLGGYAANRAANRGNPLDLEG